MIVCLLMLCTADWDSPVMCKALWSYKAQMPCDLTFTAGKNYTMLPVLWLVISYKMFACGKTGNNITCWNH